MKATLLYLFLSVLFISCSSQKQVVVWGDCTPFPNPPPVYKGQVSIAFCKITTVDSLNVVNLDSLLNKIKCPNYYDRSKVHFGVTIDFKLDSTRIAKDIKYYNNSHRDFEKAIFNSKRSFLDAILKELKYFKFKFTKETKTKDLEGILTFVYKTYLQKAKEKVNLR